MTDTMKGLLVGADPEFFVKRNGHIVPGHEFKCGSKDSPTPTEHAFIQNDGLAVEVNIMPAGTRAEFVKNVRDGMIDLSQHLKKQDWRADIEIIPATQFPKKKLNRWPVYVTALGCNADYNAYTGNQNERPDANTRLRTCSGHIHFSWTKDADPFNEDHFNFCRRLVRQLDYCIGLPSLVWDPDPTRRRLYGQAGAFRPKPYGLEYRVPSNAWTRTEKTTGFVFDRTIVAYLALVDGVEYDDKYKGLARELINQNKTAWWRSNDDMKNEFLRW